MSSYIVNGECISGMCKSINLFYDFRWTIYAVTIGAGIFLLIGLILQLKE